MANVTKFNSESPYGGAGDESNAPTVRRTRAGSEELVVRRMRLDEYQRQILLFANGRRSIDDIVAKVPVLEENPDILIGMQDAGLIELYDPELESAFQSQQTQITPKVTEQQASATTRQDLSSGAFAGNPISPEKLAETKRSMISELTKLLGSESRSAVDRVEAVKNEAELKELTEKLTNLIKLYSGASNAERFASRFLI
jgi:hypothetical protein